MNTQERMKILNSKHLIIIRDNHYLLPIELQQIWRLPEANLRWQVNPLISQLTHFPQFVNA